MELKTDTNNNLFPINTLTEKIKGRKYDDS